MYFLILTSGDVSVLPPSVLPASRFLSSRLLSLLLSSLSPLSSLPLALFQPSLPALMQIWAWTDGREQKVFTCTRLLTKRADACRAAAPLQSPWYRNRPDRRRRRRRTRREDEGSWFTVWIEEGAFRHTWLHAHSRRQTRLHLVSVAFSTCVCLSFDSLSPLPLLFSVVRCFHASGGRRGLTSAAAQSLAGFSVFVYLHVQKCKNINPVFPECEELKAMFLFIIHILNFIKSIYK